MTGKVLIVQTLIGFVVFWGDFSTLLIGAANGGAMTPPRTWPEAAANDNLPLGNRSLTIDEVWFGRLVTPSWCAKRRVACGALPTLHGVRHVSVVCSMPRVCCMLHGTEYRACHAATADDSAANSVEPRLRARASAMLATAGCGTVLQVARICA